MQIKPTRAVELAFDRPICLSCVDLRHRHRIAGKANLICSSRTANTSCFSMCFPSGREKQFMHRARDKATGLGSDRRHPVYCDNRTSSTRPVGTFPGNPTCQNSFSDRKISLSLAKDLSQDCKEIWYHLTNSCLITNKVSFGV